MNQKNQIQAEMPTMRRVGGVSGVSGVSRARVGRVSGAWRVRVGRVSGACQACVRDVSGQNASLFRRFMFMKVLCDLFCFNMVANFSSDMVKNAHT